MLTPQFVLALSAKLVVDLFAGGGGASTGIEQAIGRHVDIAVNHDEDAIGMHESTVSRVTSNKYVSTPRGVFELKFFFTAAISATDGAASHSADAVRHRIQTMLDGEGEGGDVLSDDRIVEVLKEAGVDIARRTVAKYREALRIPSSVQRRRMLKAG